VAERHNKTILDIVYSMLKIKNMSKEFWVEVVQCTIYVQNRCPHQILENKTLHEYWTEHKSDIAHMRVFRSMGYTHILNQKSAKLVFIDYDEMSKAYKLYNPIEKK
jgi:glutaredoxin